MASSNQRNSVLSVFCPGRRISNGIVLSVTSAWKVSSDASGRTHLAEGHAALFEVLNKRPVAVVVQIGLRVLKADATQQLQIELGDVVAAVGEHGPVTVRRAQTDRTHLESGTIRPSSMQVIVV